MEEANLQGSSGLRLDVGESLDHDESRDEPSPLPVTVPNISVLISGRGRAASSPSGRRRRTFSFARTYTSSFRYSILMSSHYLSVSVHMFVDLFLY